MQLIFNRNRTQHVEQTSLVKSLPWPASHVGHPHWPCAGPSLCKRFGVTTGAAPPPSSADSWSIGFREPRLILARIQSGLSDLGLARWDGQGERDEISIQKRAFFTLYIFHSISTLVFLYHSIIVLPKIGVMRFSQLSLPLFPFSSMTCWVQERIYPPGSLAQCQPRHFSIVFLFTFQCELILCQHH